MKQFRFPRCRQARGLTQIELILGLLITMLTLGALAAFTLSTAQAWRSAGEVQNAQVRSVQATSRIQETIRTAKYLGWGGPRAGGGSAVMFWRSDANNDGRMQLSEIGLLEHDAAEGTVAIYWLGAGAPQATNLGDIKDIDGDADVDPFKGLSGLTRQVLAKGVTEASFAVKNADHPRLRPSLEYRLVTQRDGKSFGEAQVVAVRAPRNKPVRCDTLANCVCVTTACLCQTPSACACSGDQPCRAGTAATTCHESAPTTAFSTITTP